MWFSKNVGGINLHPKKIYYYLDLPCVATVYLLIVNKFRVFCMKFFKNFISFLTYGFRTDTHSANSSQEKQTSRILDKINEVRKSRKPGQEIFLQAPP